MINHLEKLYSHRELLFNLVKRELKVKYKRSVFGFLWSFLNPIVLVVVYTIAVGKIMGMDKVIGPGYGGVQSFSAYLLSGLLAWNYFANSLIMSVGSFVDSGNLVKKIYFPREIIPFASVLANLVNFGFELIILVVFLSAMGIYFYAQIPFLLIVILIETILVLAISLQFSLANIFFRDMKHLVSVFILIWFWTCPVIYPLERVQGYAAKLGAPWILTLYKLNPVASLIILYQDIFYRGQMPSLKLMAFWLAFSVIFFIVSLLFFKTREEKIASEV